jgi:CBS domain-containing protein
MTPLRVRDVMTTEVVTVSPETALDRAVDLLLERGIAGVPVVDAAGRLVGMLTEQDCLRVAYAEAYHQGTGRTVSQAMTRDVEGVDATLDLLRAVDIFLRRPFRRLPVLEGDRLVGVISRRDALRALRRY